MLVHLMLHLMGHFEMASPQIIHSTLALVPVPVDSIRLAVLTVSPNKQ